MKVAVTGSSGLVGTALLASLRGDGHTVVPVVRRPPRPGEARWDPVAGTIDAAALEGLDAVVHLAGESIAAGRWTSRRRARIRDSRIQGTGLLAATLAKLERPPPVLVSASAIGYYGHRGDEVLTEEAAPGEGFLAEVARRWEQAADPARDAGIRVAHLRTGIVLSRRGGALRKMLLPFRLGLGGPIAGGRQWWSWIALDDHVGAMRHVIGRRDAGGPVNLVSPTPVTNREFTRTLGRVLRRPTAFPIPASAMRIRFGRMADELLLPSQRVVPARLDATGYVFKHPTLEKALRAALAHTPG